MLKLIGLLVFVIIVLGAVAKDRASFRALEIIVSSDQLTREYMRLKSIIPGYATWKLTKVRREMDEQYNSEDNQKHG